MAHYDAILIGTGQSAPSLAAALAGMGEKVALIEGSVLGGSCVNYGCTPTKTLRKSARVAYMARQAHEFGVHVGDVKIDFGAVMARKDGVVNASRDGLEGWLTSVPNLTLIRAWAHFDGKDGDNFVVRAGDETLTAPRVFLNTGTHASILAIEGIQDVSFLDNISLLQLDHLPEHLIILGGGYIGVEMGQIFARLGSKVSIVEYAPHLASREDEDVCQSIESLVEGEGVGVYTGHKAKRASQDASGIHLTLEKVDGSETVLTGTHLLVAVGRVPNTDNLNLESIGLQPDERGFLPTNGRLETALSGVWALGDINKRGAFTHTSYQDFEIVLANLQGGNRSADGRMMAYAMYTDPPLGRVGMSENEARKSGKRVLMAVHQMANVSRAKEESETHGLIKLLVDADTEQFLGATVFGIGGDEIIQVISNFMATGASYHVMKEALPVHPTVAEFFPTILGNLQPLD